MKKLLLTFNILLFCLAVNSQEKINYLSDEKLNEKIGLLSEQKKYDSIIYVLNKISPNDSIYDNKLVSKSYYLMQLNKYEEALLVLNEGLQRKEMSNRHSFYVNKSVCYENLKDVSSAVQTLETAISEYPMNSEFHYRKGMIYYRNNEFEKSLSSLITAMKINPFDENIHLNIGNICLKQHLTAQALMCFNMYLLLNPEGESAFAVLNSLNDVLSKDNTQEKIEGLQVSKENSAFEEMNMVLDGKISLSKKYKIKNPINLSFTRQNQIFMEMLKDYEGNDGLWSKSYIEFYKWIYDNEHFDDFIYTTTFSIKNKKFKAIVDKKIKSINNFVGLFKDKWEGIMTSISIDTSRKDLSTYFYNRKLQGVGRIANNQLVGDWTFYDAEGRIKSEGSFDEEGNRIGNWEWKYNTGVTKEIAQYKAGLLVEENKGFHENGKLNYIAHYKKDSLSGNYKLFNYKGALSQDKNFKQGLLEGSYNSFHEAGKVAPKFELTFEKGAQNGIFIERNTEGTVVFKALKVDGKVQGKEELFYNTGVLKSVSNYVAGDFEGVSKTFYKNGKLKSEGKGANDNFEGERKLYYPDGVLNEIENYNKGALNGTRYVYAANGKIHYEFLYRKGELIGYKFYNTKGEIIKEAKKKGGEFYYEGYTKDGNYIAQGLYDIKGGKEGEWKFYYNNGVLSSKGVYKNGAAQGLYMNYHVNGKVKSKIFYEQDTIKGFVEYFSKTGAVSSHGWVLNGENDKIWRDYYRDGTTIYKENFYHKGKFHGTQKYFSVEGKLVQSVVYKYGEILSEEFYGQNGKVIGNIDYNNLQGAQKGFIYHDNGKIKKEYNFLNGVLQGNYIKYNIYGAVICKGAYKSGNQSGKWTWYFANGKTSSEISYFEGERHGKSKFFHDDGTKNYEKTYNLGNIVSSVYYAEDGNIIVGSNECLNGELHGKWYSYSETGKLQLIRFFEYDRIIGYSYLDKMGKELPMIPIINETAKIVSYFDNGKKAREIEYKNGELVNDYVQYYYSGNVYQKKFFVANNFQGEALTFYSNGLLKRKNNYHDDNLQGLQIYFYPSGKLKKEVNYSNDELSGAVKYFDENGKLEKTENYFNGDIYSVEK